jgi:hypothetical protein
MAAIAPPPAQDRRSVDRRQTDRRQPRTPVIVPSIVLPSEASLPGAYVEGTRSPMFNFVPRTIGRAEDEDLISPLTDVLFDPSLFTASGPGGVESPAGTWQITAANLTTYCYQRHGRVVSVAFEASATTITRNDVQIVILRVPFLGMPTRSAIGTVAYQPPGAVHGVYEMAFAWSGPDIGGGLPMIGLFYAIAPGGAVAAITPWPQGQYGLIVVTTDYIV